MIYHDLSWFITLPSRGGTKWYWAHSLPQWLDRQCSPGCRSSQWVLTCQWHQDNGLFARPKHHFGDLGVSIHGASPSHHPFLGGIFPYKPSSYWGTPIYGTPIWLAMVCSKMGSQGGFSLITILKQNDGNRLRKAWDFGAPVMARFVWSQDTQQFLGRRGGLLQLLSSISLYINYTIPIYTHIRTYIFIYIYIYLYIYMVPRPPPVSTFDHNLL